jgi:hypothetical protein
VPRQDEVVARLGNVRVDGQIADLVVLGSGLIAVPADGDSNDGNTRMREIIGRIPLTELARMHRFIPFEEVSQLQVRASLRLHAKIVLHDGRTVLRAQRSP